ncbi:MAG: AAA domain-containing protein [Methanococcoides sp.]|nr:AAA domain-containing protein [Methanococcoides sp.]
MKHKKFDEVLILTNAGISTLLTGEKGSGKTTVAMQIAEGLETKFYSMSMTRQTTLSHLMGFMSVNGTYVPSQLRIAAEEGGLFLLDEIDAADANVLLCLNTIENGYISCPDGIIQLHKDFRLMATSNPQDEHQHYVGRSKLDAATLDRFDIIDLEHDEELEKSLVDDEVFQHIKALRVVITDMNSSISISMRDAIRYQNRKKLNLTDGFIYRLTGKNRLIYESYLEAVSRIPKYTDQSDCNTLDDLYDLMKVEFANKAPLPAQPGEQ